MSHAEPPETESRKRTKLTTKKWKKMVPVSVSSGSKVHNLVADNNLEGLKKHLGKHSSDVKVADRRGRTPLHLASVEGHVGIVNLLLDKKAPVEALDMQGLTPLHCGCMSKNTANLLQVVMTLVNKGHADVMAQTNAGTTPLHYFVRNECEDTAMFLEVLSLLLSHGACVNAQTKLGETPLHQAAIRGLEQNVMMLISGAGGASKVSVNIRTKHGETALHSACRAGSIAVARMLLDIGANPLLECAAGTPIDLAEAGGHLELVKILYNSLCKSEQGDGQDDSCGQAGVGSVISFSADVLSAVESMGHDPSIAVACLYRLQKRGAPTNDVQLLVEEIGKYGRNRRECAVCLCADIDCLLLPCRHSATCLDCTEMIMEQNGQCPICRGTIEDMLRIFLS